MRSLRARILSSASLVLAAFLGVAGVLLDQAFRDSAADAVEDRLRGRIFLLLGAADFDADTAADLMGELPDPALSTPGSGHYARIVAPGRRTVWASRSLLGSQLPLAPAARTGTWHLAEVESAQGEALFALTYGILWEGAGEREPRRFSIEAYENQALYLATTRAFRRRLWTWFAALSVALLCVQAFMLNRGLRPLGHVGEEVRAIEAGTQEQIEGRYPPELANLTSNLNKLLRHNRDSLQRYRNALGDLAHAIKTPLAVLRNEFERNPGAPTVQASMLEQIERIDRTVHYHLQRAAAAGQASLGPARPVAPVVERLMASLRKVYAHRGLSIEAVIDAGTVFPGDEGDLMEIVGNLADNACKWARTSVRLDARSGTRPGLSGWLSLSVRDDGPGMPADRIEALMQRGVRLDESVEGHGIGLAIVRDMVEGVYQGTLELDSSPAGTIARVELTWS